MRGCRPLTEAEIKAVTERLSGRDRALFVTGIRTGYRISELLSLRIRDVWDGSQVRSMIAVQSRHMKGNAPTRGIALHAEAKAALEAWIRERLLTEPSEDAPLFVSKKTGEALDRKSAWRILNSAFKAAGVAGLERQLGTHAMRKTFALRMRELLGPDLIKLRAALGHASINSTAQYYSFDEDEIQKAILAG